MVNDRQAAPNHGDREIEEVFAGRTSHRAGSGRLNRGGPRGGGHRNERREPWDGEGGGGGGGEGPSYNERSRGRRGGRGGGGGRGSMQPSSGSDRKSKVKLFFFPQHCVDCFILLF